MLNEKNLPADYSFRDSKTPEMSAVFQGLFRQKRKFLLVLAIVFGLFMVWVFGTRKRFTSEMILVVQNARGGEVVTAGGSGSFPAVNDISEEQLNSEVAVLTSNDLLDEVVDPGWNTRAHDSVPRSALIAHEKAVRSLQSRLDVNPIRTSHAIVVKVVAATPDAARAILESLLGAFRSKQKEIGRLPNATAFFEGQVSQHEKELAAARLALAEYQNAHGFISLPSQEATLETKLQDLQSSARDSDVQINELEHRSAADRQQLSAISERVATTDQSSVPTQTIDQLNVLLVNLKNRRTELLMKFKSTDRLVQEVDQQIANTTAGLRDASTMRPHAVSSDLNPLFQASKRDLTVNSVALSGMRARSSSLEAQIENLQSQLRSAELQSVTFDGLQRKVTEFESEYQSSVQKRDESILNDKMDNQQWLNVAVVQSPTLSLIPSHPQPARDLALGFITALLLAGCTVFLFETVRQQVSTPAELELISRYPVLATIPLGEVVGETKTQFIEVPDLTTRLPGESSRSHFDQGTIAGSPRERQA